MLLLLLTVWVTNMASVIRGSDNFDSNDYGGLGHNQTWQDLTASRAKDTTYTNNSGKPIQVIIRYVSNAVYEYGRLYVDGLHVSSAGLANNSSDTIWNVSAIVPNGSTYRFEDQDAVTSITWLELR